MAMAMAMAMVAVTPIFSPNPITLFSAAKHAITNHACHAKPENDKRESLSLPRVVASSVTPFQPLNADYLESEFGGHGATFEALGDGTAVVTMSLDNGSTAVLMLPGGLVASYKAAMWHRGTDEMLHSLISDDDADETAVRGGLSLALDFRTAEAGVSWSPSNWVLQDIRGSSRSSIQVELLCADSRDMIEVRHVVSLREDELSSNVVITNSGQSTAQLSGCVLSHLRVSSPEAAFAIGLEGSDYFGRRPFASRFCLVPPEHGTKRKSRFDRLMSKISFRDQRNVNDEAEEESEEGEEDENYKNLKEEMSLVYTSAPRIMTILDRGRRNSVAIGRKGFEELYMFSPGSSYEFYGKYSYICVGQSAMLKPITVGPGKVLHLGQDIYNPNL